MERLDVSLFKTSPDILKVKSTTVYCQANPSISPTHCTERKHNYLHIRRCSLCELELPVVRRQGRQTKNKETKQNKKHTSLYLLLPENTISNRVKAFLVFILFHHNYHFIVLKQKQKIIMIMVPLFPEIGKVPPSADLQFSDSP